MTNGPGDATPPATGRGREQVISTLKAAFVQGRLTKDEFEQRVGQALAFYAKLDALTADIPAGIASPAKRRPRLTPEAADKRMIQRGTAAGAGLTFIFEVLLVVPQNPALGLIVGVVLSAFVAVLLAGFLTLLSWALERRSPGQPGQRQGPMPPHRPRHADQADPSPETGQDPPHAVEATRRRLRQPSRFDVRGAVLTP